MNETVGTPKAWRLRNLCRPVVWRSVGEKHIKASPYHATSKTDSIRNVATKTVATVLVGLSIAGIKH